MVPMTFAFLVASAGAGQSVSPVDVLDHVRRFKRLWEALPAGAAVEFIDGRDLWLARHHIDIEPWHFVVPVFVLKRSFRSVLLHGRYCSGISCDTAADFRSEEHTSELQSLMRISYAVFCLKNKFN